MLIVPLVIIIMMINGTVRVYEDFKVTINPVLKVDKYP